MSNKGSIYRRDPFTEEHCEKLSQHMKDKWQDPKYAKKAYKRLRESKQTEEFRKKMSKIATERHKNDKSFNKKAKKALKNGRKFNRITKNVKRPNDYCGVVSMSDFKEMCNE